MTRKKCLNCDHADIVRYDPALRRFPMGVFCKLVTIPEGADPRDYLLYCDERCEKWQAKQKEVTP